MSHLKRVLEKRAAQAKEIRDRWAKDYPTKQPGENVKGATWKTYSRQKGQSEAFREGYDLIDWNA